MSEPPPSHVTVNVYTESGGHVWGQPHGADEGTASNQPGADLPNVINNEITPTSTVTEEFPAFENDEEEIYEDSEPEFNDQYRPVSPTAFSRTGGVNPFIGHNIPNPLTHHAVSDEEINFLANLPGNHTTTSLPTIAESIESQDSTTLSRRISAEALATRIKNLALFHRNRSAVDSSATLVTSDGDTKRYKEALARAITDEAVMRPSREFPAVRGPILFEKDIPSFIPGHGYFRFDSSIPAPTIGVSDFDGIPNIDHSAKLLLDMACRTIRSFVHDIDYVDIPGYDAGVVRGYGNGEMKKVIVPGVTLRFAMNELAWSKWVDAAEKRTLVHYNRQLAKSIGAARSGETINWPWMIAAGMEFLIVDLQDILASPIDRAAAAAQEANPKGKGKGKAKETGNTKAKRTSSHAQEYLDKKAVSDTDERERKRLVQFILQADAHEKARKALAKEKQPGSRNTTTRGGSNAGPSAGARGGASAGPSGSGSAPGPRVKCARGNRLIDAATLEANQRGEDHAKRAAALHRQWLIDNPDKGVAKAEADKLAREAYDAEG